MKDRFNKQELTLRTVKDSDLEALLLFPKSTLELFYFSPSASTPFNLLQLKKIIKQQQRESIVLEHNKQLLGFANFQPIKQYNIAFIGNLIIHPNKRKQGLGYYFLSHLIAKGFQELQLKEIHLSCYQTNTNALSLYANLGFQVYAEEQRYVPDDLLKKQNQQSTQTLIHLKRINQSLKASAIDLN
jgi:RimJ/RimL family protein N-acetyltransferase